MAEPQGRYALQEKLETILGSRNVYYQPPESIKMEYPAIVYERSRIANRHANDEVYIQNHAYLITVISKSPDSDIVETISKLPLCRHDRHFVSDNLNHDVFTLYWR